MKTLVKEHPEQAHDPALAKRRTGQRGRRRWLIQSFIVVLGALAVGSTVAVVSGISSGGGISPIAQLDTADYHALAIDPEEPNTVLFGHHGGILKSTDGGRTWIPMPEVRQDAMNLAVSHRAPDVIYLAGHNVFMKSEDGGATWQSVQNDLPGLDLHWFDVHPDDPQRVYANTVGSGLFTSADSGATWAPWDAQIPGDTPVTALAVLGGDPVNVLAGTEDGLLLDSHDGGSSWHPATEQRLDSMPMDFALNPDTGAIYVGTMEGVYRSADAGLMWQRLPLNTSVMTLAAGGAEPERVIVVNNEGAVFRSDDGGRTW